MTSIYGLIDPRDRLLRYIGKSDAPHERLRQHIVESGREVHHRAHWIQALLRLGLMPEVVLLEQVAVEDWEQAERWWIAWFRALGAKLVNDTDGGDGGNIGPEARERMAAKIRGVKRGPLSEAHRAAIGAANKGKKRTIQQKSQIAKATRAAMNEDVITKMKDAHQRSGRAKSAPRVNGRFVKS